MGKFIQKSFIGGMNLLLDDTRLAEQNYNSGNLSSTNNLYRLLYNGRNRYDIIDPIPSSIVDISAPPGLKQEMVTFGNYILLFVSGLAYYRLYSDSSWQQVPLFSMSITAPRYWTCAIPLSTTNYGRLSVLATVTTVEAGISTIVGQATSAANPVFQSQNLSAAFGGNTPGLLVQDGINQPQFIFLDPTGYPTTRTTQNFSQWSAVYGTDNSNYGVLLVDDREYVPIGTTMAWQDGILFMASIDGISIFRSVSGRPLDFMVNVNIDGSAGGDATTTCYTVGVGPISCIRPLSTGGIYVSALDSNFSVIPNFDSLIFGEPTFKRTFLFEGTCLSDRTIFDSLGDTKFIDLTGVRSFNAIQQQQNEGRNSVFTATIASAFKNIVQDISAAILFNNYELYAVNTVFGPTVAIWDTINQVWVGFDISQTGSKKIKIFAKIELSLQALYAVTEDDKVINMFSSLVDNDTPTLRVAAMCADDPEQEQKVNAVRVTMSNITKDYSISCSLFVNNRFVNTQTQSFKYTNPIPPYDGINVGPDISTQTDNILFSFPNALQGWKSFLVFTWTGTGSLVFIFMNAKDTTPMQPPRTQAVINDQS